MINTKNGSARLLDFVSDCTMPSASLCELTGDPAKANAGRGASGLERRVAKAWVLPAASLSCAQCRMLVGQRLGLQWLARPIMNFVIRYPKAECDLFPGDLTAIALVVLRDIAKFAPEETDHLMAQDFEWLRREASEDDWGGSILKKAIAALDEARQI
jgi:hypothetical protein